MVSHVVYPLIISNPIHVSSPTPEVTAFDPIQYFNGFLKGLEPDCKYKPIDLLVWERGNLPDKDILFVPCTIWDPLAYIVVPVFNVYAGPFEVGFVFSSEGYIMDVAVSSLMISDCRGVHDVRKRTVFDGQLQIEGQDPEENILIGLAILAAFNGYSRRLCRFLGEDVFRNILEKIRPTIVNLLGVHDTEMKPV